VIRFKCIYCGHRILACDGGHGKKGKCPNCQHMLVVPYATKGRPAVSSDYEPIPDRPRSRISAGDKDLRFGSISGFGGQEDAAELYREKAGWLIPSYDELSLFLMAVTLVLLYVVNVPTREDIYKLITKSHDVRVYMMAVIFLGGMCLSIYHVFTAREKTSFEKMLMLFFAVVANAITGIIAGVFVIKQASTHDWLLVFPVWNIINGVLLLLMLRFKIIDEECISDRRATFIQVILGLLAVSVVLILCNYVFKLYWAITFSICIIYTTSFDRALQNVFPGLTDRGDE